MKLVFYNHHHNGDIHLSRGFVIDLIAKLKNKHSDLEVIYSHRNNPALLADLDIGHSSSIVNGLDKFSSHNIDDDAIYINTWYGADNKAYIKRHGISFDSLYFRFRDINKLLDFELTKNYSKLYPKIYYSKFERTENIKTWISKNERKRVLVCNDPTKSGQSFNCSFGKAINLASAKLPDYHFYYTCHDNKIVKRNNVFHISEVFPAGRPDLNETAYLASSCGFIFGQASGAFTFCFNQDILFGSTSRLISLTKGGYAYKLPKDWLDELRSEIKYSCKISNYHPKTDDELATIFKLVLSI